MLLRSRKQTTPPIKLEITENTQKKALKKRNRDIYCALKRMYKIRIRNIILSFRNNVSIYEDNSRNISA